MLFGEIAFIVCIIAVALLGFSMMNGHLHVQRGVKVVSGLFVLAGAQIIAIALLAGVSQSAPLVPNAIHAEPKTERETLTPTTVDPFSGA